MSTKDHWENVYQNKEITTLGWYQSKPTPSLDLVESLDIDTESKILIVGAGATTLVDNLLELGYTNLVVNDISQKALNNIKSRVGTSEVEYVVNDLTNQTLPKLINGVDLWHDRAVLHFLTEESQQNAYKENLDKIVNIGGHVLIAAFSLDSANKCSGLDVKRYSVTMLENLLGSDYLLLQSHEYTYTMPNGSVRPYIYTLFKKLS